MRARTLKIPSEPLKVPEMVIDLDKEDNPNSPLARWGGTTLLRVVVFETRGGKRKRAVVHISARVSGDIRAGCTHGLHMRMEYARGKQDTCKAMHVAPWLPVCKDGTPM